MKVFSSATIDLRSVQSYSLETEVANSVILGANFKGTNLLRGSTTIIKFVCKEMQPFHVAVGTQCEKSMKAQHLATFRTQTNESRMIWECGRYIYRNVEMKRYPSSIILALFTWYGGTRLIRTPRGYAILSVLSRCPYMAGSQKKCPEYMLTTADNSTRKRTLLNFDLSFNCTRQGRQRGRRL